MWTNETIFSAGDLAQREKWIEFMRNEFGANGKLDEESVDEAMRDRRSHIKSCIERLQDELEITDQFENELRAELRDDEMLTEIFKKSQGLEKFIICVI